MPSAGAQAPAGNPVLALGGGVLGTAPRFGVVPRFGDAAAFRRITARYKLKRFRSWNRFHGSKRYIS